MSSITIYDHAEKSEFAFERGANLMDLLRSHGYNLSAPCGGRGLCGKCRVLLDDASGERSVLACRTLLEKSCTVRLDGSVSDITWNAAGGESGFERGREGYGAAVDLGTTTVALSLFRLTDGKDFGTLSRWNAQKSCGADVITRIGWCMEHTDGLNLLGGMIREQITQMLSELCCKNGIQLCDVKEIFLAGNTVMQHIFALLPPERIASAPFTPLSYFDDGKPVMLGEIPVFLSPCVAGYVGGDITAGIFAEGIAEKEGRTLFIDVGTNGEMALGGKDGFTACAVASGPAFEGAGISCGMAAETGAVSRVELTDEGLSYEVIGGGEAKGLCGSGLLDLAACLLELGYIDESGCLAENEDGEAVFWLTDGVFIDRHDVRALQLAKAAIAAGIKLLMRSSKLRYEDIDALVLAGGFGSRLRPESAVRIGMLPKELLGKITVCGNASLAGARRALLNPSRRSELNGIKKKCSYIELSSESAFNETFVDEMYFPEV